MDYIWFLTQSNKEIIWFYVSKNEVIYYTYVWIILSVYTQSELTSNQL